MWWAGSHDLRKRISLEFEAFQTLEETLPKASLPGGKKENWFWASKVAGWELLLTQHPWAGGLHRGSLGCKAYNERPVLCAALIPGKTDVTIANHRTCLTHSIGEGSRHTPLLTDGTRRTSQVSLRSGFWFSAHAWAEHGGSSRPCSCLHLLLLLGGSMACMWCPPAQTECVN